MMYNLFFFFLKFFFFCPTLSISFFLAGNIAHEVLGIKPKGV